MMGNSGTDFFFFFLIVISPFCIFSLWSKEQELVPLNHRTA